MASVFDIKEHLFEAQHIREYPPATAHSQEEELYEPLWEDLVAQSSKHGFMIRAIWITDIAWQGKSGIIN
ncbi:hypothetical protein B0H66DRAFT_607465 [Apodospora peruviana]|uniref:Uncharacterized protein n=1 Tax=Apodospora peruviana TaxID=516989 RepID=A0AAE0M0C1_9PEZI|nr:hypothetical protein B0H66DRAFT_607465 [Apodospora peruviana]